MTTAQFELGQQPFEVQIQLNNKQKNYNDILNSTFSTGGIALNNREMFKKKLEISPMLQLSELKLSKEISRDLFLLAHVMVITWGNWKFRQCYN